MKPDPDLFPKWMNSLRTLIAIGAGGGAIYAAGIITFGFTPYATDVGYMPEQPIPYSHALHAGKLGIDCRYCHTTVEHAASAAVPPTQTCLGCHSNVNAGGVDLATSDKLAPIVASRDEGVPVEGQGARPARLCLLQPQRSRHAWDWLCVVSRSG